MTHLPLLPCPFCRASAATVGSLGRRTAGVFTVVCACGAQGPVACSLAAAADRWNVGAKGKGNVRGQRMKALGFLTSLALVIILLLGCAPLQRLDPVFPGPPPTLDADALTPPVEADSAPGHYAGDPVRVAVEGQKAVALALSEYAYLLAVEAWALGWAGEDGVRHPGLVDAYKLCATGRDADRDYCEGQVRARALALAECRRNLPRAFAGGVGVGGVLGVGACGAVVGAARSAAP